MRVTPPPLSIILYSGDFDRIHYALAMATAAAAMDRKVTLFITMAACRAFICDDEGQLTEWKTLSLSSGFRGVAASPELLDHFYAEQYIATFETLLEAVVDLSITCMVCEMGLRAMQLDRKHLDPRLHVELGGLASLFHQAGDGTIITI